MDVLSVLGREPAMYIGGSWVTTEERRPVINPADESTVAEVPEAGVSAKFTRQRPATVKNVALVRALGESTSKGGMWTF